MCFTLVLFFFKQKTAYEMRISDWSSDVCSSDLTTADNLRGQGPTIRETIVKLSQAVSILGDHSNDIFATFKNLSTLVSALSDSADLLEALNHNLEIGRASCRERVCQYVSISVVAVSLKKKKVQQINKQID